MRAAPYEHLKALLIEDNPHMRAILKSLLHGFGMKQITEAADGGTAYDLLRETKPDFVLTDLSMEPVDGVEFTRRVRQSKDSPNAYLPIIMVTGHTERPRITAARDAGVTEILAKPINAQSLMLRIAEALGKPRPFVRTGDYFGPDRRRHNVKNYQGPWRREDDPKAEPAAV